LEVLFDKLELITEDVPRLQQLEPNPEASTISKALKYLGLNNIDVQISV
jgi:hypothetical protein